VRCADDILPGTLHYTTLHYTTLDYTTLQHGNIFL